jgi:hypothetical protein
VLHSVGKNYDIHSLAQTSWRFENDHKWTVDARKSSLAGNKPVQKAAKKCSLLGKQRQTALDSRTFGFIQDLWCVEEKAFDAFRDKYKAYQLNSRQRGAVPAAFDKWRCVASRPNTNQEEQWQSMPQTAYMVERILLDGVLFRTEKSQQRKGSKTDNSCVISHANVSYAEGEQRSAAQRIEKCFGRLQDFYLHFKYPPSKEQLRKATHKRRIDPYKVGVPFLIVGWCDWYRQKSGNHHITDLPLIAPHLPWNNDCPLVKVQDCMSMNVAWWPADPFSAVTVDSDMVVITHHEEVPVIYNAR